METVTPNHAWFAAVAPGGIAGVLIRPRDLFARRSKNIAKIIPSWSFACENGAVSLRTFRDSAVAFQQADSYQVLAYWVVALGGPVHMLTL